jgi:hypothetical protein
VRWDSKLTSGFRPLRVRLGWRGCTNSNDPSREKAGPNGYEVRRCAHVPTRLVRLHGRASRSVLAQPEARSGDATADDGREIPRGSNGSALDGAMKPTTTRLNTQQAADFLGIPEATLRWFRHRGDRGPRSYSLSARHVVYDVSDLLSWADQRKVETQRGG